MIIKKKKNKVAQWEEGIELDQVQRYFSHWVTPGPVLMWLEQICVPLQALTRDVQRYSASQNTF